LRLRRAGAGGRVHRFQHIRRQLLDFVCEGADFPAFLAKRWMTVFDDFQNHEVGRLFSVAARGE